MRSQGFRLRVQNKKAKELLLRGESDKSAVLLKGTGKTLYR